MDDSLYTSDRKGLRLDGSIAPAIRDAVEQLRRAYPDIQTYKWDQPHVAVALSVRVYLPSGGPVKGVDIREQEPIILLLHRDYYPHYGTVACSNRRDFPRERLPHLNPTGISEPVSFCLRRDNFDEWMAERSIFDLVERVRKWLFDAARNRLIPPGDGWEAARIDMADGISVYSPDKIRKHVQKAWRWKQKESSIVHCKLSMHYSHTQSTASARYVMEHVDVITTENRNQVVKRIEALDRQHNLHHPAEQHCLGILIWTAKDDACNRYFANIPQTLPQLIQWSCDFDLPIARALERFQGKAYQSPTATPIIVAIKRPANLIGDTSDIELLNLVICSDEGPLIAEGVWNADTTVVPLRHLSPLTTETAQFISGIKEPVGPNILAVGCGALGSKVVMHLARAGLTNMTLVDNDILLPHNLVRHSLLAGSVSRNKASALRDEIKHIYRDQAKAKAELGNGINILRGNKKHLLKQNAWLIDTTASKVFQQMLIECQQLDGIRIMRAELAYGGQIGIMSIEGRQRNPRLDDIRVYVSTLACEHELISDWLKAEQTAAKSEHQFQDIAIGMGCHTDTMLLADDVISLHAAIIATGFKRQSQRATDEGYLQLSFLSDEGSISSRQVSVPTVEILEAENDQLWKIRIVESVKQEILKSVAESTPDETGGILMGAVNPIHQVVHVTKMLPPPPDSRSTPSMFVRGIKDVPDTVRRIQSRTGGLIDYVGEWHSHPTGVGQMSQQDKTTAQQLQAVLKSSGRPAHIMIATSTDLHSHVYAGSTTI